MASIDAVRLGAFGGGERRRMFSLDVQQRHRAVDLDLLRADIAMLANHWIERAYGPAMLATAGPERRHHLEQRLANDRDLSALVAARCSSRLEAAASRMRRRRRSATADERELSPAQLGNFAFQRLEPLGLRDLHSAACRLAAIVGLLRHAHRLGDLG